MKNKISEKLKFIRGSRTKRDLADKLGVRHQLISDYETERSKPTTEFYNRLAEKEKVNLNWLLSDIGDPYLLTDEMVKESTSAYGTRKVDSVPLVGEVECGIPLHSWNGFGKDYVPVADVSHFNTPFLLKAKGESMYPYIRPGDLLLCADEPQRIKDKSIVVVSFKTEPESAEANAKLISYPDKNRVMLYSINSNFKPTFHKLSEIYKIYKVIKIIREVK